jgi:hypothetical protein
MLPTLEAAEICVAIPVALCLIAPVGCLAGMLFLGGLALAPVACILTPFLCCLPCALCCCAEASAGDETGPGLYVDRHPVFYTPYGPAVFTRGAMYSNDGEDIYIVNSTVFTQQPQPSAQQSQPQRRSGVVITELPPDADEAAGKQKAA